jgi:hypothetical protein
MISCKIIPLQLFQEISNGENNLLFKRRNKGIAFHVLRIVMGLKTGLDSCHQLYVGQSVVGAIVVIIVW